MARWDGPFRIQDLDADTLAKTLLFLAPQDLARFASTNRRQHDFIRDVFVKTWLHEVLEGNTSFAIKMMHP